MARASPADSTAQHWTDAVYRTHALLLYDVEAALFQNDELARKEIAVLCEMAEGMAGKIQSPVLDVACGPGRHTRQLARAGYDVIGLDFSEQFLRIANARSKREQTTPRFVCGDMRKLEFPDRLFGTAVMLGNSFGYFSDEENTETLQEVQRVLRRGGLFCLEITNKERYLANLQPVETEFIDSARFGRLKSEWKRTWDSKTSRVKTWEQHASAASGEIFYRGLYEIRLYDMAEIEALLKRVGFSTVAVSRTFSLDRDSLATGWGESWGAMGEVLFIAAIK